MSPRLVQAPAGPASGSLAEIIAADLERRVMILVRAAARVRGGDDPDAAHDLRVAIRRLSAALQLWRDGLRRRSRRATLRALRRLRRRLGPVREAEMQVALLAERLATEPAEVSVASTRFLARLERRVARGRRRAVRAATPELIDRIAGRVARAAGTLPERYASRSVPPAESLERLAASESAARSALDEAATRLDGDALHEARITIKKWRYALECLASAGYSAAGPSPGSLRAVQEVLGELHDRGLLHDLLLEEMARGRSAVDSVPAEPALRWIAGLESDHTRGVEKFRTRLDQLRSEWPPAVRPPSRAAGL
jgi:CHAD domain-containing protein